VFLCVMYLVLKLLVVFFFQAEDGIRDRNVTGVQTCALPISGINVPIRNITSINNVKTILFLISATRMKFEIVRNIKSPLFFRLLPRSLLLLQLKTYVP